MQKDSPDAILGQTDTKTSVLRYTPALRILCTREMALYIVNEYWYEVILVFLSMN